MDMTGNTLLVTGGGSGIGRALAEAFHALGNPVVITGRDRAKLDATVAANPGMAATVLDIADAAAIDGFAKSLIEDFPKLDAVIHNAGIMQEEKLSQAQTDVAEATIATNLLGPIRLTAALLPHLLARPKATIMTVTSGLAHVPLSLNPAYCASKAAIHSWTQSLRYQLQGSAIQVLELVPPYVRTSLQGRRQAEDPKAMPLEEFIAEVMAILKETPGADEILVKRVQPLRFAEKSGHYDAFYRKFNEDMVAART